MKQFYFIGRPRPGQSEEFFRRLREVGGTPPGWRIYPYTDNSGKALHVVNVESQDEILNHLQHFQNIYEWSEIVEITEPRS